MKFYGTQTPPVVGYDGTQIPIAIGNADFYDLRRFFRAGLTPLFYYVKSLFIFPPLSR